jgi:murein DD-endopeptidase MepM/ murein hydrolase activator NlpD
MSAGSKRAALSALLLLLLLPACRSWSETLFLQKPDPMICVTDSEAIFRVEDGALRPEKGMFSFSPPGETPLTPRCMVPETAQPGELVRLYVISDQPLDSVSVEVSASDSRTLSRGAGFRFVSEGGNESWAVLLGKPAAAAARGYSLSLRIVAGTRHCLLLRSLTLKERGFFSERIPLSSDLTDLMTAPNPKKTTEYRELVRILTRPHFDAIYEMGAFSDPLPGARRTAGYGDRREYVYADTTSELSIHQGVDCASPVGTPVAACGRGRVVFAGARILTGNTIVIEHLPGLFSLYYHLSALLVESGALIENGQLIGEVGMTGLATGPHLHWEVEALGTAVDPDSLVLGPLLDKSLDF